MDGKGELQETWETRVKKSSYHFFKIKIRTYARQGLSQFFINTLR
jgi:hypothetical protein